MQSASDFPDRLPPMLVKELRQGLRTRSFVAVFLCLQLALVAILLTATGASVASDQVGNSISFTIITLFSIALLIVQPLRGTTSIHAEIKAQTIDMMVLTRLSASRIVFGKWFALVTQSALLLAAIFPYLILRYFYGGMNVLAETLLIGTVFITSAAITAITVGLSATNSVMLRAIVPLLALLYLLISLPALLFSSGYGGFRGFLGLFSIDNAQAIIWLCSFLVAIVYLGWSTLSLAGSLIAPPAENLSTVRRLVTLGLAVIALGGSLFPGFDENFLPLIFLLMASPAFAIALTEPAVSIPTLEAPFEKRGVIGKIASTFLLPGWPAGIVFCLLLVTIFSITLLTPPLASYQSEIHIQLLSILGSLLLPAVIVNFTPISSQNRFSSYLLILVATLVFTSVMGGIFTASSSSAQLLWFLIWSPLSLLFMEGSHRYSDPHIIVAGSTVNVLYLLLLGAKAISVTRTLKASAEAPAA